MNFNWVTEQVDSHRTELEEFYQQLHSNPELSMQETETVAEIRGRLEGYGYEVQEIGGGVVGVLANGEGPTVLYRADIDALPVKEETGLPYASTRTMTNRDGNTVPVMHACGHDVHATTGVGAARVLAENRDRWIGTYIALFQPGEETAEGAQSMLDAGLLDAVPKPDVALSQHVLSTPAAGKVGTRAGAVLSTGASLCVTVHGKGSHGSMPHMGVDPVVLASSIVMRLQGIVAREVDPFQMAVVTVGSVQAGTTSNIIPDNATLLINVRAYDEAVRDQLVDAIERIVRAECEASGAPKEPTLGCYDEYPLTDNDPDVTARVHEAFVGHFGADNVEEMDPVTASEDFSLIPDAFGIPYCYWGVGGFTEDQEVFPNHNPAFAPAMQPTLGMGTRAALVGALAWLGRE